MTVRRGRDRGSRTDWQPAGERDARACVSYDESFIPNH
jgi:hypothetical protein